MNTQTISLVLSLILGNLLVNSAQAQVPGSSNPAHNPLVAPAPQSPMTTVPNAIPPFGLEETQSQTVNQFVGRGDVITVKLPATVDAFGYVDKVLVTMKGKAKVNVLVNGVTKGTIQNNKLCGKKTQTINIQTWTDALMFVHEDGRKAKILKIQVLPRLDGYYPPRGCDPYNPLPLPAPGEVCLPPVPTTGVSVGSQMLQALNGLYQSTFVLSRYMTGTEGDTLFQDVRAKSKRAAEAGRVGGTSSQNFIQLATDALAAAQVIQNEIDRLLGIPQSARNAAQWIKYVEIIDRSLR